MNNKKTSKKLASQAGATLNDPNASKIKKSMAAGALAQADPSKQTSKEMEKKASDVLKSEKFSDETKSFAASIVSQSNKDR